ncbi:MAG: hypothetical protein Q4E13_02040 [Clostridia bacterium]|nr:hypothetical protein [Clostridia bacterium]
MKRIKTQIDDELSGVRVSPELRRRLIRAAEREARRQRIRRRLALGGSVAGIAAALVLVCGLALLARGYRPIPGGGAGDPIRPLSPGQPEATGIPPLINPNETPEFLLPSAVPTATAETLDQRIRAWLIELADAQNLSYAEPQLQQAVQGLLSVAALDGGPDTWIAPIHQILVDDLGMLEGFVSANGLVDEFVALLSESSPTEAAENNEQPAAGSVESVETGDQPEAELPDESWAEAGEDLEDQIRARLIELADAQGITYAELQLQQATAELTSVAALDGGPDTWIASIHRILADDLAVSETFIDANDLVIEFAEYLNRTIVVTSSPQPTAGLATEAAVEPTEEAAQSIFQVQTLNYACLTENVAQAIFTIDAPDSAAVPELLQNVTVSFAGPDDGSLSQTARKRASEGVNVLYQFNCSAVSADGIRVMCTAVLESPPETEIVMRILDAEGGIIAENLTLNDDGEMQIFSIGLYAYEEYGAVAGKNLSGDLRMDADGAVLLVPPLAILFADIQENRMVGLSDDGSAHYHASSLCPELGQGSDRDMSPAECTSMGIEPCPVCMPDGEAAYSWEGWTIEDFPFNGTQVVPNESGAYLFGWMTMEAFEAHARQIGGSGKLDMTLCGQRGAGDMAYDSIFIQFDSLMSGSRLKSVQQFAADSPTYNQFMGIMELE